MRALAALLAALLLYLRGGAGYYVADAASAAAWTRLSDAARRLKDCAEAAPEASLERASARAARLSLLGAASDATADGTRRAALSHAAFRGLPAAAIDDAARAYAAALPLHEIGASIQVLEAATEDCERFAATRPRARPPPHGLLLRAEGGLFVEAKTNRVYYPSGWNLLYDSDGGVIGGNGTDIAGWNVTQAAINGTGLLGDLTRAVSVLDELINGLNIVEGEVLTPTHTFFFFFFTRCKCLMH